MARRGKGRSINGIILLDKPTDISSNHALQRVKRIFFANKAGHTGALDPLATGMLPVCLGEATKFSQFLLDSDKRYIVTATLGVRTTTSDSQGDVVSERPVEVTQTQLDQALDTFRGDIMQVPSMFSALKHKGQPLYKYAREGITIEREARPITVYEINQLRFEGNEVELDIHVSKGTYIRTIVDDLGELLGCGAHVSVLRRTQVADYPYDKMVTIEQLEALIEQAKESDVSPYDLLDPLLLDMDTAVKKYPEVNISDEMGEYVLHGQPVQVFGAPDNTVLRITVGEAHTFIGVGKMNEAGLIAPTRLANL
ncbi:tRNA pseudouridine synthase B [Psychromonas ingrahamii 37]|uniref:tRNA pseudouridine synthase B n=1 Tax=Psychromonas ingrahamii (strain DSM 17664 / CCUG 51855 / 37) TaxID=357804 RepID=TRUB_PSYIN|nr:tRNA pseudouridine(55) synthase TruB [Psychromonas ingrahamii]A1ST47.1 RecName: Full=tRNA pseudouridine synthase B; AltName: Full=tRNA pseudouridine(55) synthase; Short=Psi55 synthase; AltName: Full=tRNA pseudouridylate synthase; AltName: Full=tRNA-uridine isomerase [Psychromonas ingrahamii 37]ABM02662.1 tRNA pseudouridine synthase B [Psychromonas ingrahamii 37]